MQTKFPHPRYPMCILTTQVTRKMIAYYNQALSPLGITANQLMALSVLWPESGMSLGVFAGKAGMGKAAAVTMVRRLETMDLVTVGADPDDARLNVISLTEKAREMAPEIRTIIRNLDRAMEQRLGAETLKAVIHHLETIKELDFD